MEIIEYTLVFSASAFGIGYVMNRWKLIALTWFVVFIIIPFFKKDLHLLEAIKKTSSISQQGNTPLILTSILVLIAAMFFGMYTADQHKKLLNK